MVQEQLSQSLGIPGAPAHGATINNGTNDAGGIDMQKFEHTMFIVDVGTLSAGASVTAKLQVSPDNSTWSDLAGGAANAITAASKTVTLEVRPGQIGLVATGANNRYVRCRATETAGFNAIVTVIGLGGEAHQAPAAASDNASISQRLVM